MATTVATYPGSTSAIARASATTWTNTGNIVSDNATDATCNNTTGNGSYYLVASNFGFALSSLATIRGITVVVQASEHSTGTEVLNAQLQNDSGALFGGSKSATISGTTKVNYTYGSVSDAWSATLTPEIVNNENFGVRVWFTTSHDIRIDFIRMTIEYGEGIQPGGGTLTLEGFAPALTIQALLTADPGVGALTAEGYAPTVERTSEDVRVSYARLNVASVDVRVSYARADVAQTGAVSVVPPPGLLTVTGPAPTVLRVDDQWITADVGTTTIETYAPDVVNGENQGILTLSAVNLTLLAFSPAVAKTLNQFITPGVGEVTVIGPAPALSFSGNIVPDVGALTAEGYEPTILMGREILLNAPSNLTAAGLAPNIQSGAADVRVSWARLDTQSGTRTIGAGEITVTGYPPAIGAIVIGGGGYRTVSWEASEDPGVTGYWIYWDVSSRGDDRWQDYRYSVWVPGRTTTSYTVTSLVPGVMYYFNMTADDGTHGVYESDLVGEFSAEALDGGLFAAGHAPVITQTLNVLRTPGAGAVTVEGFAPSLDLVPAIGAGAITAEGFAPSIDVTATVGLGAITVVGHAVTLETETINAPVVKTGEVTIEGYAPRIDNNSALVVGVGEITVEGFAPDVALTAELILFTGLGEVTAEGYAPTVATTGLQWITFDTATPGVLQGFEPNLLQAGAFSLSPGAGVLGVVGHIPNVTSGRRITAASKKRRVIVEREREEELQQKPQEKPARRIRRGGKVPSREVIAPVVMAPPVPKRDMQQEAIAAELAAAKRRAQEAAQREADREAEVIINEMIKRSEADELQAIMQILMEEDRARREKLALLLRNVEAMINEDDEDESLLLLMMSV